MLVRVSAFCAESLGNHSPAPKLSTLVTGTARKLCKTTRLPKNYPPTALFSKLMGELRHIVACCAGDSKNLLTRSKF